MHRTLLYDCMQEDVILCAHKDLSDPLLQKDRVMAEQPEVDSCEGAGGEGKEYDPAGDAGDQGGAHEGKRAREDQEVDPSKRSKTELSPAMSAHLKELLEEQVKLVPFASALPFCAKLLQREIDMVKAGKEATEPMPLPASAPRPAAYPAKSPAAEQSPSSGMREVLSKAVAAGGSGDPLETSILSHQDQPNGTCKTSLKVMVPTAKHPGFNFIGRLLGPRGNTLKELQANTGCKMLIRGKGSVKFRHGESEWEMAKLPQHAHLSEPLHVIVDYEGPTRGRDSTLSQAESMLRELCTPPTSDEADQIKRQQLRELALINGTFSTGATEPRSHSGRGGGGYPAYGRQPPPPPPSQPPQHYAGYGTVQYQHTPAAQQAAEQASMAAYQQGFVAAQQALQAQQMAYQHPPAAAQDPYQQYYGGQY